MFIFYMKSQYKVFKMALPLKINAEAQADASSDDPICQNLIATQCIGSLITDKLISGKDQHVLTTITQSCKNVPTVPTSWCYFFWPVLIFGKNTRKQAKNRRFFGAIFWGGKLVDANFFLIFLNFLIKSCLTCVPIFHMQFNVISENWT